MRVSTLPRSGCGAPRPSPRPDREGRTPTCSVTHPPRSDRAGGSCRQGDQGGGVAGRRETRVQARAGPGDDRRDVGACAPRRDEGHGGEAWEVHDADAEDRDDRSGHHGATVAEHTGRGELSATVGVERVEDQRLSDHARWACARGSSHPRARRHGGRGDWHSLAAESPAPGAPRRLLRARSHAVQRLGRRAGDAQPCRGPSRERAGTALTVPCRPAITRAGLALAQRPSPSGARPRAARERTEPSCAPRRPSPRPDGRHDPRRARQHRERRGVRPAGLATPRGRRVLAAAPRRTRRARDACDVRGGDGSLWDWGGGLSI